MEKCKTCGGDGYIFVGGCCVGPRTAPCPDCT